MYRVTIAARTPAQSAAPTLTEVGPVIDARGLKWETALNAAGTVTVTCDPRTLPADVKSRFLNLAAYPCELWLYRNGTKVHAGPVIGLAGGTPDLTITAPGLLYYTRYMAVAADHVFTATDQWTIARTLIAQWQALDYGDFGLDVSAVTLSGVTRDRTYLGTVEEHLVGQRLAELAAVLDGFDFWIDPVTRALNLAAARGSDLSATVILDARGITKAGSFYGVAAGDIASEAAGRTYDRATDAVLTSTAVNTALRATFGRCAVSGTWDGITDQQTLDDHTGALLTTRAVPLFTVDPALQPVSGAAVGDYDVGDTVTWDDDDGIGRRTEARRVARRTVTVTDDGDEEVAVDFA